MAASNVGVIETLIENQLQLLKRLERMSMSLSVISDTLECNKNTKDSPAESFVNDDGTDYDDGEVKSAAQKKREKDAATKVTRTKAKTTQTRGKSPLFDDDDPPPKTKASADKDWIKETVKVARQRISEGIKRADINAIIVGEGLKSVSQADAEQAKRLHDAISALGGESDDDEF